MFTIKKDKFNYEFKIIYKKGGMDLSGTNRPRGYRLLVTKYIDEGDGFIKYEPMSDDNMIVGVKKVKRFSQKTEDKLDEILDKYEEELVELYFSDREEFVRRVFEIFKEYR